MSFSHESKVFEDYKQQEKSKTSDTALLYRGYSDAVTSDYQKFTSNKNKITNLATNFSDEVEDFRRAATLVEETFNAKDIGKFLPEQLLDLLMQIHSIAAKSLYANNDKFKTKPGQYRNDIEYVLRHPLLQQTLSETGYYLPNQYGRIALFLEKEPDGGKQMAIYFLSGYYKLFILPTGNHEWIKKYKSNFEKYYQKCFSKPFFGNLDEAITADENQALERIYHFFIDHKKIKDALINIFKALHAALKSDENAIKIYAEFYINILEIHPFEDANARVVKLFLSAILYRKGYLPIMLQDLESRKYYEHFYNKNPDKDQFYKHLILLFKQREEMVEVMYSGVEEENYLDRLSACVGEYNRHGMPDKLVQVNKSTKMVKFPLFWVENLSKAAISELSQEARLPIVSFRKT